MCARRLHRLEAVRRIIAVRSESAAWFAFDEQTLFALH